MSFLARWLFGKPSATAGLRPHRDVMLALGYGDAYARVLESIELALGAYVAVDDRKTGFIEAAFGLVNSERVRCTLQPIDDDRTSVRIEAFFPAGAQVRETSQAVDALADMLEHDRRA